MTPSAHIPSSRILPYLRRSVVLAPLFTLLGCLSLSFGEPATTGDGRIVHTADATCVYLDPENARHSVAACESAYGYRVQLPGGVQHYDKRLFQNRMRDQLQQFLRASFYQGWQPGAATVQVWLEAPVLQPDDARFIAVVDGPAGTFAAPFGLNQQVWQIVPTAVQWLGTAAYPSPQARRSDLLTLFAQPTVDREQLRTFLEQAGALSLKTAQGARVARALHGDGTVVQLQLRPFAAPLVARMLRRAPGYRAILAAMEIPLAGGRESSTAPVFHFPLMAPAAASETAAVAPSQPAANAPTTPAVP